MHVHVHRGLSGSPPLLQTFVSGPLLQNLVAGLCVEYCSLQKARRREGLSQDPPILVQALLQKRFVTSPMFLGRCHIYIYMYTYTYMQRYTYICMNTRVSV